MAISIQALIGQGYNDIWWSNCDARYRVAVGARDTKKSYDLAGLEPIFKIMKDPNRNIIMCRQDDVNNNSSTYPGIVNKINKLGLASFFRCKVSPYEIIYKPTGQKIVFKGCNNPEAITSTAFVTGELTDIYFEEASELNSYDDFRKIDGSVRPRDSFGQITFLMNGWDKKCWIYDIFFKDRMEDDYDYLETHDHMQYYDPNFNLGFGYGLFLHKSTFRINEFRTPDKDQSMAILKEKALEIYKVEGLGMWGNSSASTYLYFGDQLIKPHSELIRYSICDYIIGIDFGMGNGEGKVLKNTKDHQNRYRSATTMQMIAFTQGYEKIIALQEFFDSNENRTIPKGTPEIATEMILKIKEWKKLYNLKGVVCYVDSADSGGFRTVLESKAKELDCWGVVFIPSTKNKIQTRVDFENLMHAFGEMLYCDNCKNLIREIRNARQAEDGRCREDTDDHCINAWEYAWIPILPRIKRYKDFKEH